MALHTHTHTHAWPGLKRSLVLDGCRIKSTVRTCIASMERGILRVVNEQHVVATCVTRQHRNLRVLSALSY